MKREQRPETYPVFLFLVIITLILLFLWGVDIIKAEAPNAPSANFIMYGVNDTMPGFSGAWKRNATGTISGGIGGQESYSDSQIMLTYVDMSEIWEYGSDRVALFQWMADHGEHPEGAFAHWTKNTFQAPPYNTAYCPNGDLYTFRPGWDVANDTNGDYTRDWKSDWNHNRNSTHFTVDNLSSGADHIQDLNKTWSEDEWAGQYLRLGSCGGESDTISYEIDSNTVNRIYVHGDIPATSYAYYLLDQLSAPNHNAVAMADSQARVGLYCYCDSGTKYANSPMTSFGKDLVRQYFAHSWAEYCRVWRLRADSFSVNSTIGMFRDNVYPNQSPSLMGCPNCIGGNMEDLDDPGMQDQPSWTASESLASVVITESLHTVNNCMIIGNLGDRICLPGYYPRWCHAGWGYDGWLFEGKLDIDGWSWAWITLLRDDVKLKNSWGKQNWYFPKNSCCSYSYDCGDAYHRYNERFLAFYAFYLAVAGHRNPHCDTANFIFTQTGYGYPDGPSCSYGRQSNDTLGWWRGYAKFDLGTEGPDSLLGNKVIKKVYEKGIVLLHPQTASGSDPYTVGFDGKTLYEVDSLGNLGSIPYTQYTMDNILLGDYWTAMGRIFGEQQGEDSLQQVISNVDSSQNSVTTRDSVITLLGGTDKIVLLFASYNSLDSASRTDSLSSVDTAQFLVSGLSSNQTYYYWFEAQDEGVYDTSSVGIIHTLQAEEEQGRKLILWLKR